MPSTRLRHRSLPLLFALCSAACGATAPPSTAQSADVVFGTRVHMMPVRNDPPSGGPSGAHLDYYGGHVISNVKVYEVLYGSGTYASEISGSQMQSFYTQVVQSPFVDWLSEYDTNITAVGGQKGTNQIIGRGSFGGKVQITPSSKNNGSSIDDTNIQAEIAAQISAGHLAAPDANTLYMLHFPKGKTITQGGTGSCVSGGFCAYHGTFTRNGASVYYGVLPDMESGSGCDTGCGNDPTPFNNQTSVASHEFTESITDAEVGLATTNAPPLAWYDNTNGEIGDICNAQQGSFVGSDGVTYVVQQEWSNQQGMCVDHGSGTTGGCQSNSDCSQGQVCVNGVCQDPGTLSTDITSPADGATVSGTVTVTASATAATKIEIYLDGALLTSGTSSPLGASWDSTQVADGSHQIDSKAYGSGGAVATSATVTVTVSNGSTLQCPPGTTDVGGVCVPNGGGGGTGCSSSSGGTAAMLAVCLFAVVLELRRKKRA